MPRLGEIFDLSSRQKAVLECLKGPHAQDFLTVIPIEGLGQCMSAVEYRAILKYRLIIPMYPEDETCTTCRKACMDKYGEHAVHCKELLGFKYRHDWVRNVCKLLWRWKKVTGVVFMTTIWQICKSRNNLEFNNKESIEIMMEEIKGIQDY
ncbi:putative exostosin [Helianthus annuus]|nr:putative exostosin [Helianthus annuus]KAJ0474932.1 putative exostosin [Helianthus annuus]KAJ0650487.1 putative exostosin [Helianthus annuus]KAJ0654240.1 putative exostosin [Helianthus annuus]